MNVVNECEPFSAQIAATDASFLAPYNAAKGDLLLTARRQVRLGCRIEKTILTTLWIIFENEKQLDKLGVQQDHLPNSAPFSVYLDSQPPSEPTALTQGKPADLLTITDITNPKLSEAIGSIDAFDKMYMVSTGTMDSNARDV